LWRVGDPCESGFLDWKRNNYEFYVQISLKESSCTFMHVDVRRFSSPLLNPRKFHFWENFIFDLHGFSFFMLNARMYPHVGWQQCREREIEIHTHTHTKIYTDFYYMARTLMVRCLCFLTTESFFFGNRALFLWALFWIWKNDLLVLQSLP